MRITFMFSVLLQIALAIQTNKFFSDLFEKSVQNVIYLVFDCEFYNSESVTQLIRDLPLSEVNIITIPTTDGELKPFVFTRNVQQLRDALENLICASSNEPSHHYQNVNSILSRILPITQPHDNILLLTKFHHEDSSPIAHDKFSQKHISINLIHPKDSTLPRKYEELAFRTGGKILTYDNQETQLEKPPQNIQKNDLSQSNFEISSTQKTLNDNARIDYSLPSGTIQIFLTLNGDFSKALLISPSGAAINILSTDESVETGQNRNIKFNLMIANSPALWTLSADGKQYNATFTMVANRDKEDVMLSNKTVVDENEAPTAMRRSFDALMNKKNVIVGLPFLHGQPSANAQTGFWYGNNMPTLIDVDLQSTFFSLPGEQARFTINVRNNKLIPSYYRFYCFFSQQPCFIRPMTMVLAPQQTVQVTLLVKAEGNEGSSQIISFVAQDVERKIFLYVGRQKYDTNRPEIDYQYNGNCDDANAGNNCHKKHWSVDLIARDTGSGLLNFWSEPMGLIYTTEFIVGTRDHVGGRFSASCCFPKVDICAMDLRGNINKITLDVEHQYLNWIEITAIVLGSILLIVLIALVIYGILRWRRKRNERSFLNS